MRKGIVILLVQLSAHFDFWEPFSRHLCVSLSTLLNRHIPKRVSRAASSSTNYYVLHVFCYFSEPFEAV